MSPSRTASLLAAVALLALALMPAAGQEKDKAKPTKGQRSYKARGFEKFSATSKFPPAGQKDYKGTINGETFSIETDDGKALTLKKVKRESKSLGKKPPEGAVVLFDGTNMDEWQ